MHSEQEKVNEIIEELVKNFDEYMHNVNDRLKINSLFNEFEDKSRNDLMSLVKLSNTRYKSVKSGNTLQNVIGKQLPVYHQIVNSALNDQFYQANDIFQEKKKFRKMNNRQKNSEIQSLRANIKENTKCLSLEENGGNLYEGGGEKYKAANLRFMERLSKVKSPTMEEINDNIREKVSRKDYNSKSKISPNRDNRISESMNAREVENSEKNNVDTQKLFSELVLDDKYKFENQMKSYYEHLEEMKNLLGESETIKSSKKFTFLTDDLKILSFKQTSNNNKVEKKDNNDKVEIKKLMKYAKSAKSGRVIKDHLTQQTGVEKEKDSRRKSILTGSIRMNTMSNANTTGHQSVLQPTGALTNLPFNLSSPSVMIEKGNTIQIVKNEIINSVYINDIIQHKRDGLNACLKDYDLPTMEDYEKILMRNITTQKISQHTSILPKSKEDKNDSNMKREFPEMLKEKYTNKQVQWKIEDIQQENLEKLEKERRKETKMFLNQIKKRPRFAQQFIDHYSQRDNKVNHHILDINKILGKQFYDKKKLNRKIDEFIYDLDRKELEQTEKLKSSPREPPSNSANHEIKKLLQKKNLLDDHEDDLDVEFGKRENEIIFALVNDGREKEKSPHEKKYEVFQDFQKFKDKVI
jgi:hypothetical protein